MVFPLVQLVILGYAMGGNVKHLKVAIVDQDGGLPAVRVRELAGAVAGGANTFETVQYADQGAALTDLRNGRINGVLTIPPEFSRRVLQKNEPHVALIEDNTDNFVSATLVGSMGSLVTAFNQPAPRRAMSGLARLDVVEVYPYVPYVQYLLPGIDRDVDLHDGDDRRRHHLHRRQGARAARGLPGDADHQARAGRRASTSRARSRPCWPGSPS